MECTNPRMRERLGHISVCVMDSRLLRLSWIHRTRSGCTWRCKDIHMARTRNAEYFAQPLAGRDGKRVFKKTRTTALPEWEWNRRKPKAHTPRCGGHAVRRGKCATGWRLEWRAGGC